MTIGYQDSRGRLIDGPKASTGFIRIPLTELRELSSNATINAAGNGGLFASDTTPIFEAVNGATDSALRLRWAASNVDAFTWQTPLPADLDPSQSIIVKYLAAMGGASDTPTLSGDHFFGIGGTKRTVATAAVTGTTAAVYTATIAASSIPTNPVTLSAQVTPGAHGTDTLLLYAVWIEYSRL